MVQTSPLSEICRLGFALPVFSSTSGRSRIASRSSPAYWPPSSIVCDLSNSSAVLAPSVAVYPCCVLFVYTDLSGSAVSGGVTVISATRHHTFLAAVLRMRT